MTRTVAHRSQIRAVPGLVLDDPPFVTAGDVEGDAAQLGPRRVERQGG
jgi:hypothetical protein